jgi:UDP-hydrolysing UDP-N-acetyl-D-glucosamine 2-epimerase
MSDKRKVCVVSGSRADYGLLKNLIGILASDSVFDLKIAVTGPHLSPTWGETYREIENDGFNIDAKIPTLLSSDELAGMSKALGLGIISFTDYFSIRRPDYIIVLGDRFEILAAAQAAYCLKIPVVHLHGGEVTSGALDDYFRQAISKLASLHFVAHDLYARRLVQMGEHPSSVIVSGALGIDQIANIKGISRDEVEKKLGVKLWDKYFLIVNHPSTAAIADMLKEQQVVKNIWTALESSYKDHQLIVSLANADPSGYSINKTWKEIVAKNGDERVKLFYHFGSELYLGLMNYTQALIGNSSSGILETPYFNKPTVNIGHRQDGRFHPSSVVSTDSDSESIKSAVDKAMDGDWQKQNCISVLNPFGEPGTVAKKIVDKLKEVNLKVFVYKEFYDIKT